MTGATELAPQEHRRLIEIADDLSTFVETLAMLEAQLEEPMPDDERAEIERAKVEVQASILTIGLALANKTDAVASVLRRLGGEQELIVAERQRLKKRELAVKRADDWLRDYVLSVMRQQKVKQLKTATNTLFIRGSEKTNVFAPSELPAKYWNAEVKLPLWLWNAMVEVAQQFCPVQLDQDISEFAHLDTNPSLSTIKRAIKGGEAVPGAELKASDNLVVR